MAPPWSPPVDTCSRCGAAMPAEPNGWTWNKDKQELVCPDCETPDEGQAVLGYLELTPELERDVLADADAQTRQEAEILRRLTSGEDDA